MLLTKRIIMLTKKKFPLTIPEGPTGVQKNLITEDEDNYYITIGR